MKTLARNCCGLGNPWSVRALQKLVWREDPDVIFLSETIITVDKLEGIRHKYGTYSIFGVDPIGRSGGLAMIWKNEVDMVLSSFSKYHIDMDITDPKGEQWRITGFYGEPNSNIRCNAWTTLTQLSRRSSKPWLCLWDFNEILWDSEKSRKCLRPQWQMENFKKALEDAELVDLGYISSWFTWEIGKCSKTLVRERLDCACSNKDWID
ncbi:hypothetical protein REPUB_Repub19eG0107000 [Reevesia pubescens]